MSSNSPRKPTKGRVTKWLEKAVACMLRNGHKKCPKDFEPFQTRPGVNLRELLTPQISGELCEQKKQNG